MPLSARGRHGRWMGRRLSYQRCPL